MASLKKIDNYLIIIFRNRPNVLRKYILEVLRLLTANTMSFLIMKETIENYVLKFINQFQLISMAGARK